MTDPVKRIRLWGVVLEVRKNSPDYVGLTVSLDRFENLDHTAKHGDTFVLAIDSNAQYVPVKGDKVRVTLAGHDAEKRYLVERDDT